MAFRANANIKNPYGDRPQINGVVIRVEDVALTAIKKAKIGSFIITDAVRLERCQNVTRLKNKREQNEHNMLNIFIHYEKFPEERKNLLNSSKVSATYL